MSQHDSTSTLSDEAIPDLATVAICLAETAHEVASLKAETDAELALAYLVEELAEVVARLAVQS